MFVKINWNKQNQDIVQALNNSPKVVYNKQFQFCVFNNVSLLLWEYGEQAVLSQEKDPLHRCTRWDLKNIIIRENLEIRKLQAKKISNTIMKAKNKS